MPKVLVFEDLPDRRAVVGRAFSEAGFEVAEYESPTSDPVAVVLAEQPDVISMDVLMPGMDGFEAARRIKADIRTRAIPLIFYTYQSGERATGMQLGAAGYFVKDVDSEDALAAFAGDCLRSGA